MLHESVRFATSHASSQWPAGPVVLPRLPRAHGRPRERREVEGAGREVVHFVDAIVTYANLRSEVNNFE